MLFNSIEYFIFLPFTGLLFFVIPQKYRWLLLLLASYFYYMFWRAEYAILMLFCTALNYWTALQIVKLPDGLKRRNYLIISLAGSLGVLFLFKYLVFFNEAVRDALAIADIGYSMPRFNILLPVGISFFTFQSVGYVIDVYRRTIQPEKHFGIFALYVSFFPQLVAGPIERASQLIPQFYKKMVFDWNNLVQGGKIIIWGLFKKMIIADNLAIFNGYVFSTPEDYSGNVNLLAAFGCAIEIYCDFSGYTDIAIGSARILGFRLMDNFNRPYLSDSIPKLWKRWHISLTSWIYDYMGNPLKATIRNRYLNLCIIFLVIGFWHGATWNFIAFGLLHALYMVVFRLTETTRKNFVAKTGLVNYPVLKKNMDVFITFSLWSFSGFFVMGESISDSLYMITHCFSGGEILNCMSKMPAFQFSNFLPASTALILLFWIEITNSKDIRNPFNHIRPAWLRWAVYLIVVFYLAVFGEHWNEEFYYYRF